MRVLVLVLVLVQDPKSTTSLFIRNKFRTRTNTKRCEDMLERQDERTLIVETPRDP